MSRTSPSDFWLNFSRAGLEICWLAAWVNYFAQMIFGAPYPWHNAMVAFLGSGLALWLSRRGRRRIYQVGLIHLIFLAFALLWGLHSYYGQGLELWDKVWMRAIGDGLTGGKQVMILIGVSAFSLMFWFAGRYWYLRARDYDATSRRFDLGLASFLALYLFKFLLRVRFEEYYADPFGPALLIGFFCFALPALSWSRSRNRVDLPGGISGGLWRSSLGILITAVLLAGGAAAFYLPYLNQAAQTGYVVMQKVVGPLLPYLVDVLRFIFSPRSADRPQASSDQGFEGMDKKGAPSEVPRWLEIVFYIIGGVLSLIVAALVLTLLVLALRHLLRWLASSTGERKNQPSLWQELCEFLALVWGWIVRHIPALDNSLPQAVLVYYRFKKWGRRSGLAAKPGETPREYGGRVARDFPGLALEVGEIVAAHERAVYARNPKPHPEAASLRKKLRRLASPLWWPRRLKLRWRGYGQS